MYKGYPFSASTYWRRKRKAEKLGCDIMDVPDNRGRHKNHAKGSRHHKWNNGRLIDHQGYTLIRVGTSHPLACPNGYMKEHILVYVSVESPGEYLYKKYPEKYVIHHKNGDISDNRYENLACIERSEHNRIHNKDKPRDSFGRFTKKEVR